jgi:putative spermidine/putrescine transport system ATP-binding protein
MTIELRNIKKAYNSVTALSDINLTLAKGEFLTLLGPTGCGKSTLLRIIAGFAKPTSGEVLIDGKVINDMPPNERQVGLLFQSYALFPHMTVEENVGFGLRVRKWKKAAFESKVDEVLSLLAISHLRKRYPAQLSGGQQQRTALARTLAIEPRVLLLDEPLAALDRKLKLEMQVELKKLVARVGITTICVSHDQDEALTMSDKIALMDKGRIEQYGEPLELYDRPQSSFAAGFLGKSNLLTGVVSRHSDQTLFFESNSFRISLRETEIGVGTTLTILLRPEHLLISEAAVPSAHAGEVVFATQFGYSVQYDVKLDSGPALSVTVTRGRDVTPFAAGARVYISLDGMSAYQIIERSASENS